MHQPACDSNPVVIEGLIELISNCRISGWVWNRNDPSTRQSVVIRTDGQVLAESEANVFRTDLVAAGIGDGCYSFDLLLEKPISDTTLGYIDVAIKGTGQLVPIAPAAVRPELSKPKPDSQLNVYNFEKMRTQPPREFAFIRFDPNNNCNLRCVYCHNHRSQAIIETEQFKRFLDECVISVESFQLGCIMEPTLDARITDLMLMISQSPARPSDKFILQTNGILLHRHDYAKMKYAGLNRLGVSLDSAEPETQSSLRLGSNLDAVVGNVASFRNVCPDVIIEFVCTVTRANIDKLESLVQLGLDLGVKDFVFREMFYNPQNEVVDHARMPALLLNGDEFANTMSEIANLFCARANFVFASKQILDDSAKQISADSMRALPSHTRSGNGPAVAG